MALKTRINTYTITKTTTKTIIETVNTPVSYESNAIYLRCGCLKNPIDTDKNIIEYVWLLELGDNPIYFFSENMSGKTLELTFADGTKASFVVSDEAKDYIDWGEQVKYKQGSNDVFKDFVESYTCVKRTIAGVNFYNENYTYYDSAFLYNKYILKLDYQTGSANNYKYSYDLLNKKVAKITYYVKKKVEREIQEQVDELVEEKELYTEQFQDACLDVLQRQFNYTNIACFQQKLAGLFDKYLGDISERLNNEVLNINTCSSDALNYFWGLLFKISRTQIVNNIEVSLNDTQFREILSIRLFNTTWQGDLISLNSFLNQLFKDRGLIYIEDNLDMTTILYVFNFELEDWERYLFEKNQDILPRQAGVGNRIQVVVSTEVYFGMRSYGQNGYYNLTTGFRLYGGETPLGVGKFRKYGEY